MLLLLFGEGPFTDNDFSDLKLSEIMSKSCETAGDIRSFYKSTGMMCV